MSTKDPHVAMIDAHEKMDAIKIAVRNKIAQLRASPGPLSDEDEAELRAFRQKVIDATRRVQDELYEELNSHGLDA